jgi:hypothetical protein
MFQKEGFGISRPTVFLEDATNEETAQGNSHIVFSFSFWPTGPVRFLHSHCEEQLS